MVAEDNKVYAQIIENRVHWIFTKADLPEWNENDIHTIELSDPDVIIGDQYLDGRFSKPSKVSLSVQDQIIAIEQANPITHRNLRDLAMAVAALGELVTGQPAANLPMVQTITALEQQIADLRAQL